MSGSPRNERWYALHVRPCCERSVASYLREYGHESFLPLYKTRKDDRFGAPQTEVPLFPGYIFCRIDWQTGPRLYLIPGIISVVSMGKKAIPIDDDEIEAIMRIDRSKAEPEPCVLGKAGVAVRVVKGPLAGIEGIIQRPSAGEMIVSISLLRRSVAIKVDPEWLVALGSPADTGERRLKPLTTADRSASVDHTADCMEMLAR
jgi:transcription antitermination factor NusG